MANIAVKRILRDIKNCHGELDSEHIYIIPDEDNVYHVRAMILGPEGTPYEKGFYFFDINFPKTYPHDPPKVLFMTLNNEIRFNPNLYKCGKVCLSILGTWSGPQWTSCITLKTILFSIQSLLNENPLQNEPGYENCVDDKSKMYRDIVEYYNIKVAVIQMLNFIPNGFEGFIKTMRQYYLKNFDFYYSYVMKNLNNKKKVRCSTYSLMLYPEYSLLEQELSSLKTYISEEFAMEEMALASAPLPPLPPLLPLPIEITDNGKESATVETKIKKKKCPSEPAKDHDEGFIKKSENDGKMYRVKVIKSGFKRWVLN